MSASPARFLLLPAAAGFLALSGCGTYRNATAYFNTYYNASRLFDQAVAEVMKTPQTARDSNYFAPFKVTPAAVTKFEKVIEKGSRLIQFHGESGYVEDAIMMIGKAYLYQNETESAAGKFRELLDNFPGSDKRADATLWYAKALYQGKNDEQALAVAKDLASPAAPGEGEEIPGDILLEITMLEAQIYADRGEYAQAAEVLAGSGAIDGDDRLKAIAQFQLGTVYEKTKEYARAAEAYRMVGDLGPAPPMAFNAMLREGVMLSSAGEPDRALETFDEIISWPLKTEQSGLVDLEIANSYWDKGDSAAAFTLYDIIDSTYKKTDASARSYFKRGEILEKRYRDLTGARKYFQSAKSEFPASSITQDAVVRFTALDNYVKASDRLVRDDSTLYVLLHPDTSDTSGALMADSARTVPDTASEALAATGEADREEAEKRPPPQDRRPPPTLLADENLSMRAIRARPRHLVPDPEDPGFTPPAAGDEVQAAENPGELRAGLKEAMGGAKTGGKGAGKQEPKAPLTPEELSKRIAMERFELGGIFLLDLDLPDSALYYYDHLVREHPGSPLVPRTLYAMSEAYRITGDSAAADSLRDRILAEHPETDYADQVRKQRGLDTLAAVESEEAVRYRKAEEMLFAGDTLAALGEFRAISSASTDSLIAPKAHYAVGWMYENVLIDLDSAEAWYKKLIKDYPSSVYAKSAGPRVTVRDDTSKLSQFVKIKEIPAVAKPKQQALGRVLKEPLPGKGAVPPQRAGEPGSGRPPVPAGEDEYYNPDEDEEPESGGENSDEDDEDKEEPDDDDPGLSAGARIPDQGMTPIPV